MTTHKDEPAKGGGHSGPAAHVKETETPKHAPSPNIQSANQRHPGSQGDKPSDDKSGTDKTQHAGTSANRDPLGAEKPFRRETETLPVEAEGLDGPKGDRRGDPVGHARHAETPEELEKIRYMEGKDTKVPPPGSRNYVAGQPVDDEEYDKTEREAGNLAQAGRAQRTEAEKRMAEANPGDPDYHPADPDHRDPQAGGKRPTDDQPKRADDDKDKDDKRR